ncbi:MAG: chorismate synthase [Spirochaetia bacterium]|nr:chorismate synthase [Spirochaetia bacterium]
MSSVLGTIFRTTTFGESHGKAVGCVVENCPAGLELKEEDIQPDLDRRKPGQSRITTQRKEPDTVSILSGTYQNKTTGAPISMVVYNEDQREKDYGNLEHVFRPSHADFTYHAKYGHRALTGGGRASARTTIGIVAAGAIAKKILSLKTNTVIAAYVSSIHKISLPLSFAIPEIGLLKREVEKNPVRCPDQKIAAEMEDLILQVSKEGDSVGGVIDLIIENPPVGLGSPTFDRLDALLASVMMGIPAVKGVEIGSGFSGSQMKGSEHNDAFYNDSGRIRTRSNFSGGIQGGISNGEPIYMRIAFKPTATIKKEQETVNDKGERVILRSAGRHDPCVLPRAVPIVEAAAALILTDQFLLNKFSKFENL